MNNSNVLSKIYYSNMSLGTSVNNDNHLKEWINVKDAGCSIQEGFNKKYIICRLKRWSLSGNCRRGTGRNWIRGGRSRHSCYRLNFEPTIRFRLTPDSDA